jgi:hypothetical protein
MSLLKKSEPKQDTSNLPAMTTDFTLPSADAETLKSLNRYDRYWFYDGPNGEISAALDATEAIDFQQDLKDIRRHRR